MVFRYRCYLESRQLAPGTINLPLGAVRRLDDPVLLKQSAQKGDEVLLDCEWPALPIEPELVVAESTPQSGHELAPETRLPPDGFRFATIRELALRNSFLQT